MWDIHYEAMNCEKYQLEIYNRDVHEYLSLLQAARGLHLHMEDYGAWRGTLTGV